MFDYIKISFYLYLSKFKFRLINYSNILLFHYRIRSNWDTMRLTF